MFEKLETPFGKINANEFDKAKTTAPYIKLIEAILFKAKKYRSPYVRFYYTAGDEENSPCLSRQK
jgi:hypothetical protein